MVVGNGVTVPWRFEAHFQLRTPPVTVQMEVEVAPDRAPAVRWMVLRASQRAPITTSRLRRVLVDQLVRTAIEVASVSVPVGDVLPASQAVDAGGVTGHGDRGSRVSGVPRASGGLDADARTAARIYSAAVAGGSGAPAVAVATTMHRSRSQAARYIRRARVLGLLPPV